MPHSKLTVARPDQATLLTVAVLTLAKDLRVSSAHAGRIVVKYQPGRRYLTLTPLQWTVLKTFEDGRSVPSALKHLVHERGCIPLHEYYELILQALEAGVLQTSGYPLPEPDPPVAWRFSLFSSTLRPLGAGLFVVALILLFFNPATAPAHPAWWLAGWLVNCLAASAGAFLSAGVVHAAGGDVYHPRLNLRTLLPRFSVDTEDALLHGPGAAIDLALARLAPFAALCALSTAIAPSLCLPLFCGLLWNLAPLPGQPAFRLLRAQHHSPALTTSHGRLFPPNRRLRRRLHLRFSRDNLRFAVVLAVCAPFWLALVAFTWIATHEGDPASLLRLLFSWDWSRIALYYGLGLLAFAVVAACAFGVSHASESIARRKAAQLPRPAHAPTLPHVSDVIEFLARTHPFQLVPSTKREAAARAMQVLLFNPGDVLLAKGDKRPRLYVLYAGEARSDAIAPLHPAGPSFATGSIFGEASLLKGEAQPASVHATEPGVLLILDQSPYLALVAPHVPPHKMADAAQKVALLRQSALARHWPPHLLEGFARRAELLHFNHGDTILKEGQENLWFHLLLEGELHVMSKRRRIGRIRAGDFFGEISLLQNGFASTNIVGHRPGRYLSVPKNDFLFFFAHDPAVAMQFEDVASRRLGRPVFPL